MIELVDLDATLRAAIARDLPDVLTTEVLPTAHPVWFDALARIGEDVRGLAAIRDGRVEGWLLYTIAEQRGVRVASSLPYVAYAGLHATDDAVTHELIAAYRTVDADVISLGTSPLFSDTEERAVREAFAPTHELENFVQLHELSSHPLESLSKKRRDAFASEIRRASSLRVIETLNDAQFNEWLAIYRARYANLGVTPYPDAFHRAVHELVVAEDAAEIWGVVDEQDRLRGGIVFLVSQREVTYFSSAFDEEARRLYATTFLLDRAFHSFLARGVKTFNWQSSPGKGGVFEYKKRWGAREHRHFYLSVLRNGDAVFAMQPQELRAAFPLRFVLPFSAWSTIPPDAR